jgi:uncharacterized protein (TIGR02147 family)
MERSVFEFRDYKQYLASALSPGGASYGQRSKLARALRCQPAFVSRVLNGEAHFSLEHGVPINQFLGHAEEESDFFLLLLLLGRAGTAELARYFRDQIERIVARRALISERIGVRELLAAEDQMTYYSAWYYAAIHILLFVPGYDSVAKISERLRLSPNTAQPALEFLVRIGLATREGKQYGPGKARIHLSGDSPLVAKHHTNWRMRAIDSLDEKDEADLHYSGPICISRKDALRIRQRFLDLLQELEPVIQGSPEEELYCLALDVFRV